MTLDFAKKFLYNLEFDSTIEIVARKTAAMRYYAGFMHEN